MKFSEITSKAGEFFDFFRGLFPWIFEEISEEDRARISKIIARMFILFFMLVDETRRERAMIRIERNFNALEWMVIERVKKEQQENMRRIFKLVKKGASITASMIPVMLIAVLRGDEIEE